MTNHMISTIVRVLLLKNFYRSISIVFILIFVHVTPLSAQTINKDENQRIADIISYGTVFTNLTLDTIDSIRSQNTKQELVQQGLRLGATIATTEILKRLISKERPDQSDLKSFPSMHTSIAATSQGWNYQVGITITGITGGGRILANKHDIIDVLVGFGIGSLFQLAID